MVREFTPFQKVGTPENKLPKGTKDFTPKVEADPKASSALASASKLPGGETLSSVPPSPESRPAQSEASGSHPGPPPPHPPVPSSPSPQPNGLQPPLAENASVVRVASGQTEAN